MNESMNSSAPVNRAPSIELLHIDCMEYMAGLGDEVFDLTVTSPPYDNLRDYGSGFVWGSHVWMPIIRELYRITKDGGVVVWIVADAVVNGSESGTSFSQALFAKDCGFNLHDTMIWNKQVMVFPDKSRCPQTFEYMFVFSKGSPKSFNSINDRRNKYAGSKIHGKERQKDGSMKTRTGAKKGNLVNDWGRRFNVWDIFPCQSNSERIGHPAPFPIKLAYDHIISWSKEGDIVFDPFLGGGTTALAAKLANRNFVGCELDEDYYNAAVQRFNDETKQQALGI